MDERSFLTKKNYFCSLNINFIVEKIALKVSQWKGKNYIWIEESGTWTQTVKGWAGRKEEGTFIV